MHPADQAMSVLGKRIERKRRLADLTQWELAERLGITQASVSQIESGTRQPSTKILRQLQEMGFEELTDAEVEYRALMREAKGASVKLLKLVTDLLRLAKAGERKE